jgi:hypothetical protein
MTTTKRLNKKFDTRKPLDSRGSTGVGPSEGPRVINNWARSGDATQRPEFDLGCSASRRS